MNLTCLFCGKSYADVDPYLVDTLPGQGLVAWCVECNPYLNLGTKKSLITQVVNQWREWRIPGNLDAMEEAGHGFVERICLLKAKF